MPRFHPVSISGYHIREAGSTADQELAFTLANGFAYVEAAMAAGLAVDDFAPRLSFFFNAHLDFFEEIGKFRAARRIWARWLPGALRRQGRALAAPAVPHPDRRRVAHGPAARGEHRPGRHPGPVRRPRAAPRACTPTPTTRPSPCPSEAAARIALRTQQVIAHETGVTATADPLGGSAYVEWMTDEMERRAEAIFAHLDELGGGSMLEGVLAGIDNGWIVGRDRRRGLPLRAGGELRRAGRRRRQPLHRRRRAHRATCCASAPTSRPRRSSASRPPAGTGTRPRSTGPWPPSPATPPSRRSTCCRR